MPNRLDILKKVDLLSDLNPNELNELANDFEWQEYSEGSFIIKEGENCKGFFVLVDGRAEVFINRKGHKPIQLSPFEPGDAFGEIDLFVGKPCSASVQCLENCRLLLLDRERFAFMLVRWPRLHAGFIKKLSQRLRWSNTSMMEAEHKTFLRSTLQLNQLKYRSYEFWGSAGSLKLLEKNLEQMAGKAGPVLLIGEPGSGKLLTSWFLHKKQFGVNAPFIVMDGRHLDQELGDSLFMPQEDAAGLSQVNCLLDIASGGTLFIRDINLISPMAQLKLIRILQGQEVPCCIIGSVVAEPDTLSVQLNPQLRACFGISFQVSPLRERKKDIPVMINKLLEKLAQQYQRKPHKLSKESLTLLLNHNYTRGNVAELIQIIERSFFLADGETIDLEHLFFGPTSYKSDYTFNLLSWNWLNKIVKRGSFPLLFQRMAFGMLLLTMIMLIIIPKNQTATYGLILIFGLWWPIIITSAFALGRVWCGICPVSYCMELGRKLIRLDLPVPTILKKYDYLINTFLFLLVFWIEAVSDMRHNHFYTGMWLLTITLAATITGVIFTRHTWCRHMCPLGGLIGIASINGIIEVRADSNICLNSCNTHECYRGSGKIEGCPMFQYPAYLDNNQACKFCLRCIRNCPKDAVKLNLRTPAREIWHLSRINQGYAIFIGVSLAILLPISYFEPLHSVWPRQQWIQWYSLGYWGTAILAGIITWFIARPFTTKLASRRIKLVFALIPLLVAGFMAYQLHFLPGANLFSVILYSEFNGTSKEIAYFTILRLSQAIAAFPGLILTCIAIIMVFIHTQKRKGAVRDIHDVKQESRTR